MRCRIVNAGLMASLLLLVACGGTGGTSVLTRFGGATGTVVLLAGDQPVCDVSSFQVTVTGITLSPQNGGTPVSVFTSSQPVTLDLATLMDVSTLLSVTEVPSGTYSGITFTLSDPKLTSIDFTQSPPAPATIPVTLPSLTVTYNIGPALTVPANGAIGLRADFNLFDSIQTNIQGDITGNASLIAQVAPVAAGSGTGFGRLEDVHGLVQSVSTPGSGSFTATVVVQPAEGPALAVNLTDSTVLAGVTSGLSSLLPQTLVEVSAFADSSGNIVATRLTAEDVEQASQQHAGFVGEVTSVTRLNTGFVSQFTLFVREEFPEVGAAVPLQSSLQVNVPPSAVFNLVAPEDNTPPLAFDATTFGLGQEVTVNGNFVPGTQGVPPVLNATSVNLRAQTVAGNFSQLVTAGLDAKSGAFTFAPCSGVFQGQTITVLTTSGTNFEGVANLNNLTPSPALLVRGLLFFEPTLTSAGTVTLAPPSTLLDAARVHQLP